MRGTHGRTLPIVDRNFVFLSISLTLALGYFHSGNLVLSLVRFVHALSALGVFLCPHPPPLPIFPILACCVLHACIMLHYVCRKRVALYFTPQPSTPLPLGTSYLLIFAMNRVPLVQMYHTNIYFLINDQERPLAPSLILPRLI